MRYSSEVEHQSDKLKVAGSIPVIETKQIKTQRPITIRYESGINPPTV